ncbi:hypothetical protein ACCO45_012379 [Purpureocillium lilacinum]|uniref:Uncharacterized protein n=1 Tax=Purpureocillium lilacinum TaxID=33203 RepID=A0ACC4DAC8_PURLI
MDVVIRVGSSGKYEASRSATTVVAGARPDWGLVGHSAVKELRLDASSSLWRRAMACSVFPIILRSFALAKMDLRIRA